MLRKKYTRDYDIETSLGRNGRMQENVTYIGTYFSFAAERGAVRRAGIRLSALTALSSLVVLLPLLFHSDYLQQYYTAVPTLLCVIPLYMLWAGIYRVFTAGERVTHEHRDKIANRIPEGALIFAVLSALCVIGTILYYMMARTMHTTDYICAFAAAFRAAAAVPIFLMRRAFAMNELSSTVAPEKNHLRSAEETANPDSSRVDTEE